MPHTKSPFQCASRCWNGETKRGRYWGIFTDEFNSSSWNDNSFWTLCWEKNLNRSVIKLWY